METVDLENFRDGMQDGIRTQTIFVMENEMKFELRIFSDEKRVDGNYNLDYQFVTITGI